MKNLLVLDLCPVLTKGEETRNTIVDAAYLQARTVGLEGLTIGQLAALIPMSKSGLFAHFGSKEELQLAVLEHAADAFVAEVLKPALRECKGVERIYKVLQLWLTVSAMSEEQGGCVFIAAAADFDDKPGQIRDFLQRTQRDWRNSLEHLVLDAVKYGDLPANTDAKQMAFELFSLVLACHHDRRLMDDSHSVHRATKGLDRLVQYPPIL